MTRIIASTFALITILSAGTAFAQETEMVFTEPDVIRVGPSVELPPEAQETIDLLASFNANGWFGTPAAADVALAQIKVEETEVTPIIVLSPERRREIQAQLYADPEIAGVLNAIDDVVAWAQEGPPAAPVAVVATRE